MNQETDNFIKFIIMIIFLVFVIPLFVILFDSTFGARCKHAFPNDGFKQEVCVQYLDSGKSMELIK